MRSTSEFSNTNEPWDAAQMEREREMERDRTRTASVPHLLHQLTSEVTTLFSKEVSLARAEMREAVSGMKAGIIALMGGAIVLLAGFIVLLMAAVYGLATRMDLWMAAAIVGGVVTVVGLIMVMSGKGKLGADALKPDRTVRSLRQDRDTMRVAVAGGRP